MIQDPLTVLHQQHEKRMFDGALREDSIFLTLYHFFHGSNTVFASTIGCRSFQTCVVVFQVHLFTRVFQHMFQGLLIVRSRLQTGVSRSHDCEKMFQVLQTLTFACRKVHVYIKRKNGGMFPVMSLMRAKPNARPFCADISWRTKFAKGMCEADFDCTHASLNQGVYPDCVLGKLVEPPMTVDLNSCSAALRKVSYDSLFCD